MKKSLFLLFSLALSSGAEVLNPTCPAEVNLADYYRTPDAALNRKYYATQAEIQRRGNHLLYNPKDDAAFLAFCDPALPYADVMLPEDRDSIPEGGEEVISLAVWYKHLVATMNVGAALTANQRPEFLLAMRDSLTTKREYELQLQRILRIIAEDEQLTEDELGILAHLLESWYGIEDNPLVQARQLQFIMRGFRGGKPVCLSTQQEVLLHARYPYLTPLLHAERALNGQAALRVDRSQQWHLHLLHNLLWQHTEGAVLLARKLNLPGYELLRRDSAALPDYLSYKGITYYRTLGQEVPQSCLTALAVRDFESPAAAARVVKEQNSTLPRELRPLAPRCVLALGGNQSAWVPVKVTPDGVHPDWPDASAVTLPMWSPDLLGLADTGAATVQAAFGADLAALEKLLTALRDTHGAAGVVLADMLRECDRVRPVYRDFVFPVFARIALYCEADGLTVDFNPEQQNFEIREMTCSNKPIVNDALCRAPQLLHRLSLQLALLEKHGHRPELERACAQLARVLNRSNLWPLVICQRELRGFSPQALLTLFAYYEGEREPLATYGEAMGMRSEMSLAAYAHEDELAERLQLVAKVTGALPVTAEQGRAAATELLAVAAKHPDGSVLADTAELLLRHGYAELLPACTELPPAALCGSYAGNGLLLIRYYLSANNRPAAQQVLAIMAQDAATDTTPAFRLACALLSADPAEQARLRKDALILAMFYRHVDHRVYDAWRDALAREGEQVEDIMKAELLLSGGRSVGITPELARHYEKSGQWATAAFCYEYLVAEGISTASPYGKIPTQADICRYRAAAEACRAK
ncbi:MAG: hypothetical protein Q4F40_08320 [Akkermansia sp.]|nr:hypothetical protein [Akkermansia sp.]